MTIAVLGSGPFAAYLTSTIVGAELNALTLSPPGRGFFARRRFARELKRIAGGSIVVADVGGDTSKFDLAWRSRFAERITELRSCGWQGPILHPIAALELAIPRTTDRFYFFGVQGSGNSIYQTITNEIVKAKRAGSAPSIAEAWLLAAQNDYSFLICDYLQAVLKELTGEDAYVPLICNRVAFAQTRSEVRGEVVCLFNVSARQYFVDYVAGQHSPLFEGDIAYLKARGVQPVFCKRHPLDILGSISRKRATAGLGPLQDIDLYYTARRLLHFHEKLKHEPTLVYENLLTNPIATIRQIAAELVGVRLSDAAAGDLWDRFGHRQLDHASPGHYTGGQVGAWRDVLPADTMRKLDRLGYGAVIERLGYDVPPELSRTNSLPRTEPWDRWPIDNPDQVSIMAVDPLLRPIHSTIARALRDKIASGSGRDLLAAGRVSGKATIDVANQKPAPC